MTSPLLAYYGDDFTGSADVMEVLQWSGLRNVLFLDPPSPQQLAQFEGLRAFGVAGWSRTMSPAEMDIHLRSALEQLRNSGASAVHYKTCSTFDSSPSIGSIGKALEIGREVFGSTTVPMVVGAPNLGRYQVFGNLFARSGLDSQPFRLDRHPTMQHHPITPMEEADLRKHLALQTQLPVDLIDVLSLEQDAAEAYPTEALSSSAAAILFDVLEPKHLKLIGQRLQSMIDRAAPRFIVGSSGVEYALTAYWKQSGRLNQLKSHEPGMPPFGPVEQLLAMTGSCSPVNDRQIRRAVESGFDEIAIQTEHLASDVDSAAECDRIVDAVVAGLRSGKNVILHSARGPKDPRVASTVAALRRRELSEQDIRLHSGRILGPHFGRILHRILSQYPLTRVGVAGGDTSGYIARQLGLKALEAIAPVAPGSPLCRAYSENELHGTEFFFKGGQVGRDDVWSTMLSGTGG